MAEGLSKVASGIKRGFQVGLEDPAAYGTPVDAGRLMVGDRFNFTKEREQEDFAGERGHKTLARTARGPAPIRFGSMLSHESKLEFHQLLLPLALGFAGNPTVTQPGIGTSVVASTSYDAGTSNPGDGEFQLTLSGSVLSLTIGIASGDGTIATAFNTVAVGASVVIVDSTTDTVVFSGTIARKTAAVAGSVDGVWEFDGVSTVPTLTASRAYALRQGASGAYRYTFAHDPNADPNLLTATIEYIESQGSSNWVQRFSHAFCESFTAQWGVDALATMTASYKGRKATEFATGSTTTRLTPSPASLFDSLIGASGVSGSIKFGTSWADLATPPSGSEIVPEPYSASVEYNSHFNGQMWMTGRQDLDMENIQVAERSMMMRLGFGVNPDTTDAQSVIHEVAHAENGQTRWTRLDLFGREIGNTGQRHRFTIKMAGVHEADSVTQFGNDGENEMSTVEVNLASIYDQDAVSGVGMGRDIEFEVTTDIASLALAFPN